MPPANMSPREVEMFYKTGTKVMFPDWGIVGPDTLNLPLIGFDYADTLNTDGLIPDPEIIISADDNDVAEETVTAMDYSLLTAITTIGDENEDFGEKIIDADDSDEIVSNSDIVPTDDKLFGKFEKARTQRNVKMRSLSSLGKFLLVPTSTIQCGTFGFIATLMGGRNLWEPNCLHHTAI